MPKPTRGGVTGDLTNCGGVREAKTVLDDIRTLNTKLPAPFGNIDRPEPNIHEAKGRDTLAGIPTVTPGTSRDGGWAAIDINHSQLEIHPQ